ncbi:V-type ATP synthase subunit E [Salinispira pacifica]
MSDQKRRGDGRGEDQNVQSLLKSMRDNAESERQEIERGAEEEKRKILENAESEGERLKSEAIQQADREVDVAIAGKMGRARMEAQAERVRVKNSNLEQTFALARRRVLAIEGDRYSRILAMLIRQAHGFIPGNGVVHVRNEDVDGVKSVVSNLEGDWSVAGIDGERGTVILSDSEGRRRVDNSFLTRLSRAELALRDDVSRILFGTESESSA